MASWKKVIVSGSQAELAGITGSLLTDGRLLTAENGGAITSTGIQITGGDIVGDLTGSVHGTASRAEQLDSAQNFSVSGDATTAAAVSFNGTGAVDLAITLASGSVGHGQLENGAVSGSKVADGGVGYAKLADVVTDLTVAGNVDADDTIASARSIKTYVDNQVGASTLRISGSAGAGDDIDLDSNDLTFTGSGVIEAIVTDNTVTLDVKDGTVAFAHLADGAASGSSIAADGVDGSHIVDDAIDSEHIAANAIDFEHYANGSVSGSAIAADGIDGSHIVDDAIDSEHIAAGAIDFAHLANDSVSGSAIADAGIGNAKLVNDSITIGAHEVNLGESVTLAETGFNSGSFSGSFQGDGSGLTGIATTLNIDVKADALDSADDVDINLKSETLTIQGTANEVDAEGSGNVITLSLPQDVTIARDLTVTRDLTVLGTQTTLNVEDLVVQDRFIYLASGSAGATDGGIIVEGATDADGKGFGWDQSAGRWGFDQTIASGSESITPDAYAAAVVTADSADFQKVGNIRIDTTTEDIFIYS